MVEREPLQRNPAADEPRARLGVNIDHVATLRNARGGANPDPIRAALLAASAGADGITAHLREDRRHIRDEDMYRLKDEVGLPLNFEMAATEEMLAISLDVHPHAVCLVPEKRTERTTEGGLDVAGQRHMLAGFVDRLGEAGIRVSLFIDPQEAQVRAAAELGAPVIELHTGAYHQAALATTPARIQDEFDKIEAAATLGQDLGLEIHAGHGLDFYNVQPIAGLPMIRELNIGHFLIGESVFMGLHEAIREMRRLIDDARSGMLV
ncbi:pyridoxine 5'-phosphate synthase [Aquisalinus flavus]|uniref:Pyridoxine 5'-phosphate synthase n=1 Tax=Aquisalinus flavus TaxID=1526572 RepID=A0A8J2V2N8_9PROT|nr:pyridoxine 5'-phosphate synthase [Aquisalinus flavus]MBD0427669.1 pyridoxine 5'-phosphate synthase [Aquisalinus flavus]UNE47452.1 pyridoxine 5'-phosphate synthase [Aquisalinus flavus]GGD02895.1 pyridoxine 5'-phosphate synthase [Aquisalinus flavus]